MQSCISNWPFMQIVLSLCDHLIPLHIPSETPATVLIMHSFMHFYSRTLTALSMLFKNDATFM